MPNYYCHSCGAPTSYASALPKFCSECSAPFGITASIQVQQKPKPARANVYQPQIINQEEENEIERLEELKASISEVTLVESRRPSRAVKQQETIRDIWGTEAFNGSRPNPVKGKKLSNKKILEDFVRDATPNRTRANPIEITDKGEI